MGHAHIGFFGDALKFIMGFYLDVGPHKDFIYFFHITSFKQSWIYFKLFKMIVKDYYLYLIILTYLFPYPATLTAPAKNLTGTITQ